VVVYEVLDDNAKGDVNGDKRVTILDALMILQAINDVTIITDQAAFDRADLNSDGKLTAAEALVVLKYANGEIGSLDVL